MEKGERGRAGQSEKWKGNERYLYIYIEREREREIERTRREEEIWGWRGKGVCGRGEGFEHEQGRVNADFSYCSSEVSLTRRA